MLEERRLLYVGVTRAKNKLYLVCPQNRSFYGYPEPVDPSRFLDEIPAELLQISRSPRALPGFRPSLQSRRTQWGTPTSPEPEQEQQYQPGMRVQHPTWGEGMVLNSRVENDDEVVDVFFEEVGLKRLAASLARLEIIS
jgi:DNA helicase-2/ATP-dependent DNA helicase PcrA